MRHLKKLSPSKRKLGRKKVSFHNCAKRRPTLPVLVEISSSRRVGDQCSAIPVFPAIERQPIALRVKNFSHKNSFSIHLRLGANPNAIRLLVAAQDFALICDKMGSFFVPCQPRIWITLLTIQRLRVRSICEDRRIEIGHAALV